MPGAVNWLERSDLWLILKSIVELSDYTKVGLSQTKFFQHLVDDKKSLHTIQPLRFIRMWMG